MKEACGILAILGLGFSIMAVLVFLGAIVGNWLRRMSRERRHGFPCPDCGAKTFEEAADLCRGFAGCPGDTMSKAIFGPPWDGAEKGGRTPSWVRGALGIAAWAVISAVALVVFSWSMDGEVEEGMNPIEHTKGTR